uniref:Uncharacterized protein n=1 Tax=Tanacetum cinerariifolium TaxID=118510 RepID=A0A6L2P2X2_TANCI|nr:hypothetical protein [Tanacetum cinerariifolium]
MANLLASPDHVHASPDHAPILPYHLPGSPRPGPAFLDHVVDFPDDDLAVEIEEDPEEGQDMHIDEEDQEDGEYVHDVLDVVERVITELRDRADDYPHDQESPTKSLFDVGSSRISIFTVNTYCVKKQAYWNGVLLRLFLDDLLALDSIVHFDLSDRRLEQTATFLISTNSE